MLGTFGGALEARKINASDGRLVAEVTGEIESDEGVLVIRRVHVKFTLQASDEARETIERVHKVYQDQCPVYRSLHPAFTISSSYQLV
jgi:uncharacterized OsmC-like protein